MKLTTLILLVALNASANQYFIDYGSGSDSASGNSTGAPFKHCPGDTNATSVCAGVSLAAGDIVFFKGGVSYILTTINTNFPCFNSTQGGNHWVANTYLPGIALLWSGVAGTPITYDGNSAGTWGSGRAIITDNNSTNNLVAFAGYKSAGGVSNLVFNSFIFTNIGGDIITPPGNFSPFDGFPAKPGGGIHADSEQNVAVSNCFFGMLGYYQTGITNIGNTSLSGGAIGFGSCDGLTITNCEFCNSRDPIFLGVGNIWNVTMGGCFIHGNMEWAFTANLTDPNQYRSNLNIVSCVFSNWDQAYAKTNNATGEVGPWASVFSDGPHQNGVQMFGNQINGNYSVNRNASDTNVIIRNNTFITSTFFSGGTACMQIQESTSAYIYNNVFITPRTGNGAIDILQPATNGAFQVWIFNNSALSAIPMINISGANVLQTSPAQNYWPNTNSTVPIIKSYNNVLSTLNIGNGGVFDWTINILTNNFGVYVVSNLFADYNCYFCDQTFAGVQVVLNWQDYNGIGSGQIYFTTNDSLTKFGWDAHSLCALPLFVNTNWASPTSVDLHLQTNSPALGKGTNLTALNLPGLNQDFDGNARVSSGNWTIGAYGVGTPAPPSFIPLGRLRIRNN